MKLMFKRKENQLNTYESGDVANTADYVLLVAVFKFAGVTDERHL